MHKQLFLAFFGIPKAIRLLRREVIVVLIVLFLYSVNDRRHNKKQQLKISAKKKIKCGFVFISFNLLRIFLDREWSTEECTHVKGAHL